MTKELKKENANKIKDLFPKMKKVIEDRTFTQFDYTVDGKELEGCFASVLMNESLLNYYESGSHGSVDFDSECGRISCKTGSIDRNGILIISGPRCQTIIKSGGEIGLKKYLTNKVPNDCDFCILRPHRGEVSEGIYLIDNQIFKPIGGKWTKLPNRNGRLTIKYESTKIKLQIMETNSQQAFWYYNWEYFKSRCY